MIEFLLSSDADIPQELWQPVYSAHNKIFSDKEWDQHSSKRRKIVLDKMRTFMSKVKYILGEPTPNHLDEDGRITLWQANNALTGHREASYTCSSCRSRMWRRLQKLNIK
jgi:hypothetical protein